MRHNTGREMVAAVDLNDRSQGHKPCGILCSKEASIQDSVLVPQSQDPWV